MLKFKTNYSVISENIFIKRFVTNFIIEMNLKEGLGLYPSLYSNNVAISDTINPTYNIFVISFVERQNFTVLNLNDVKVMVKTLVSIVGIENPNFVQHLIENYKYMNFSNDDIIKHMFHYKDFSENNIDADSFFSEKSLNTSTFSYKLNLVIQYLLAPNKENLNKLFYFYTSSNLGMLKYIVSELIAGNIQHQYTANNVFIKNLINFSIYILKAQHDEEIYTKLIGAI